MHARELASLLHEVSGALAAEPDALLDHLSGEAPSAEIELVYHPPRDTAPVAGKPLIAGNLPANFLCSLCPDRMYPVRKFARPGRRPVLVLYHSGSFSRGQTRMDRSRDTIFGDPAEDELFGRMLGAAGLAVDDFSYQEFPACHFNGDRSTPGDWHERGRHCLKHVRDTVQRANVRLLILTGPAAVILLGEEAAQRAARSGEVVMADCQGQTLPALVIRSPAALLALENKRRRLKETVPAGSADVPEELRRVIDEEKAVKNAVLAALRGALARLPS